MWPLKGSEQENVWRQDALQIQVILLMYLVVGISMTILVLVMGVLSLGVRDSEMQPSSVYPLFGKRLSFQPLLLYYFLEHGQHSK